MGLEALLLLVPAAIGGILVFGLFLKLERGDNAHLLLLIIIGSVVADAFLNGAQQSVPAGLFRPTFAGFDVRLPDILIVLGLAARLLTMKPYRPLGLRSLLWMTFFGWYCVGIVTGYFSSNPIEQVLFQSKVLLWMGGGMVIASGANLGRLVSSLAYARGVQLVGAIGGVLLIMNLLGVQIAVNLPGLPLPMIGNYSADASTVGVTLGVPMLLLELSQKVRRMSMVLPCLILILMPIGATQGAAVAGLGMVILLLSVLSTTSEWKRRVTVRPLEIARFGFAVLGLALFAGIASGSRVDIAQSLEENVEEAFFSSEQANTSASRVELWRVAWEDIADRPAFAEGVGARLLLERSWPFISTPVTAHNIYVDVALRLGLIGLFFFFVAIWTSVLDVIKVWRGHQDNLVATFVLGLGVALAGLAVKGLAESILEKHRLAVLVGVFIGLLIAAARETDAHPNTMSLNESKKSTSLTWMVASVGAARTGVSSIPQRGDDILSSQG